MVIEVIADDGERIRLSRGWVILTLALASWGLVGIIWLVVSGAVRFFS